MDLGSVEDQFAGAGPAHPLTRLTSSLLTLSSHHSQQPLTYFTVLVCVCTCVCVCSQGGQRST